MFIPLPVATGSAEGAMFALLASLVLYWLFGRSKSPRLVEIDYDKLSERRRRKAWERADARGFVHLGWGLHVMSSEVSVPITLGEETVCRVEGDELRVYIVDDVADFLKGGGNPKHYGVSFRLEEMKTIQVWYEPFTGYACLRIDFGHRMLAELEPNYVRFWTHHSSKERATDALVLIYERVLEQQQKKKKL